MEIKFQKTYLEDLYQGNIKPYKEYKSNKPLVAQYVKTINKLKSITHKEQFFQLKALRYEKLTGDLKGLSAVAVNMQYRIIFREVASTSNELVIDILEIEELSKHYEK
ncbi:MAG: type II toxin-antitoxin system RelE/ParE family toxin [Flavobacterium sp.]|jgi:proteic killer suppression protein|uniref:type II toxin-antitoxin system RelE/ParE family toxin n=1 Tax=Flavobacterium sp. TaxID=239 RepID=UPI0022CA3F61|nr:type II toxin-antitoxin system RelE/ParE family toxin [Flavobacterium sp.]MCZ8170070.1 type II toxin-antitoxin system RelE/ParE family toxin [Flavobacterium sp.]MCZ8297731.1 type II toxin-antitoxin system RelE/ParE family toxin [Flavobacterium sp.]